MVAETYPAEVYAHLGLNLRNGGKRSEPCGGPTRLVSSRNEAGVGVDPARPCAEIEDGFGSHGRGRRDRFDAVVGLGMLNVVLGRRPSGEPDDPIVRRIEGWILGQAAE